MSSRLRLAEYSWTLDYPTVVRAFESLLPAYDPIPSSYEFFLFVLALAKGFERLKSSNRSLTTYSGFGFGLEDILIRDSAIYYLGCVFSSHYIHVQVRLTAFAVLRCCVVYAINLTLWVEASVSQVFSYQDHGGLHFPLTA